MGTGGSSSQEEGNTSTRASGYVHDTRYKLPVLREAVLGPITPVINRNSISGVFELGSPGEVGRTDPSLVKDRGGRAALLYPLS